MRQWDHVFNEICFLQQFGAKPGIIYHCGTTGGVLTVFPIWENGRISRVKVNMGSPILDPELIPVSIPTTPSTINNPVPEFTLTVEDVQLPLSFVSMGNPHAIYFSELPVNTFPLLQIGPKVEHHQIFPKRINFHVVHIKDSKTIDQV